MQRRSLHSLVELAGREVKSKDVSGRGVIRGRGRWVMLPPVPAATKTKSLLHIMQQQPQHVSAIAWLKQCCPQISQNDAETLFRSCQVTRKEALSEGVILCLPRRSLETLNVYCRGRRLNRLVENGPDTLDKDNASENEEER